MGRGFARALQVQRGCGFQGLRENSVFWVEPAKSVPPRLKPMSTLLPYAGVENSRLPPDYKGGEFASLRYVAGWRVRADMFWKARRPYCSTFFLLQFCRLRFLR
jgi:hypothetical protein